MKKQIAWLLVLAMLFTFAPFATAFAEDNVLYLPTGTERIEDEAFSGNTSLKTVFIPENVSSIGSGAFSGCTGLTEIIINTSNEIDISEDAFSGCGDIHFIVYPDSKAELYALSHGYLCDLAAPGSTFFERIKGLVAEHGGTSALQSDFDSMRLIVRRASNRLPDISAYHPTEIVRRGDVFIIQFDSEADTRGCFALLERDKRENGAASDFQEVDCCVTASFTSEVGAAGVIDENDWGTDDPMGFDVYAPFVAENGTDSIMIAVIDSGVEKDISYLSKLNQGLAMNMVEDEEEWYSDRKGHGSYIVSVINECVGAANVSILPIRVIGSGNSSSSGNLDYVLLGNAILYAVECGANIINLSMSFLPSAYVEMCINEAIASGVTVVVAAGNSGADISSGVFPANLPQVVTVAGLNSDHTIASNYGSTVDYVAPYKWFSTARGVNRGTSFSAPMIASALALVSIDPYHSVEDMNASCINGNETGSSSNSYGCGMPQLDKLANVPVLGLTLDPNMPAELAVGEALELKWNVTPANASDRTVTVSSSDASILEVDNRANGTVYLNPKKQGTATVTITSNSNSSLSVSRSFTVVQPVTSITITGAKERLAIGRTMKLTAVTAPANASAPGIEWVSTDPSVATVSQYGLVEGKAEGTVGIYAKATDGYGAQSAAVSINVIPIPDAEAVLLTVNGENVTDGVVSMAPGETLLVNTAISPEDADQDIDCEPLGRCIQTSKTENGILVTATSAGTAYLYVFSADDKNISATLEIWVRVLPSSVQITGETVVNEGETTALSATVLPENADNRTVSWKSSDESVATVTSGGVVKGVKSGTAVITATANGDASVKAAVTVTVRHPYVISFDANKPEEELTPSLSATSKSAFSGYEVGELPTATCDYYYFQGWYTAPSGGERVTSASKLTTTQASLTLYAQWRIHEESGWVLTSNVPSGARVTQTSYSYRENTESSKSSMSGWIPNGENWKLTGSGEQYYASFPNGFDQGNYYYTNFAKSAMKPSESETSKREVSYSSCGYIYWHWMYDCGGSGAGNRAIYYQRGYGSYESTGNSYYYQYFGAFASARNYPAVGGNWNQGSGDYQWYQIDDRGSFADSQGSLYWYRFPYYKANYKDFTKVYLFYRDQNYQSADPGSGSNGITITNKQTYVKYREK